MKYWLSTRHIIFIAFVSICLLALILLKRLAAPYVESNRQAATFPIDATVAFSTSAEEFIAALRKALYVRVELFTGPQEYVVFQTENIPELVVLIGQFNEWQTLGEMKDPRFPILVGSARFTAYSPYSSGKNHKASQEIMIFHVKSTEELKLKLGKLISTNL